MKFCSSITSRDPNGVCQNVLAHIWLKCWHRTVTSTAYIQNYSHASMFWVISKKILFDSDSSDDDGIIWHNPSTPLLRIHFLGWLFKNEFHQIFIPINCNTATQGVVQTINSIVFNCWRLTASIFWKRLSFLNLNAIL